jgi:hypothetical protein
LASSAKEHCGGSTGEGEREKNAASTVDDLGKTSPVVSREFLVVSITSMSERKTSSELARMKASSRVR